MLTQIEGLHHVTSIASDAQVNNAFFTKTLGLRRVKKTVNFDAPDVYHLYYGDAVGTPGTVMTYFPFPGAAGGTRGTGEVSVTAFSVPNGALSYWQDRLSAHGVQGAARETAFGADRLVFEGPDGDGFALVEGEDSRAPWTGADVPEAAAIRGFHGATLQLKDAGPTADLLTLMGYAADQTEGSIQRFRRKDGNGADVVDLDIRPDAPSARQGAGSVHHIAFSVADRAAQKDVRAALEDAGFNVTPVIDRDYFWAIYFRTPGGVLFEVATTEPGFDRDEDPAHLGEALKLPDQHAHLRDRLKTQLAPITD